MLLYLLVQNSTWRLQGVLFVGSGPGEVVVRVWFWELVEGMPVRVRTAGGVVVEVWEVVVLVLESELEEVLLLVPIELVGVVADGGPVEVSPPAPVRTRTPSFVVSWADMGVL
jgi:hypothetical protein